MDKQSELTILQQTAEKLGPDSYCGPWLLSILPQIVADMLDGLPPTPTMHASRELSFSILVCARDEAEQIISKAKAEAAQTLQHVRQPRQPRRSTQAGKHTVGPPRIAPRPAMGHGSTP
jgi:cell division septum initiation protein DivIVA